jgi:hypothetical protein
MLETMKIAVLFVSCLVLMPQLLTAAESGSLDPQLEPLRPLLGKTWKGTFKSSTPDKPVIDISNWERALNGKAVRILHSINQGAYGGESIVFWDKEKQAVCYHYFTTGGFMTMGTIKIEGEKIVTHEKVSGNAGGATEVRGTHELKKDGKLYVKTEHLVGGEWKPGRETVYEEDPSAKVVFK